VHSLTEACRSDLFERAARGCLLFTPVVSLLAEPSTLILYVTSGNPPKEESATNNRAPSVFGSFQKVHLLLESSCTSNLHSTSCLYLLYIRPPPRQPIIISSFPPFCTVSLSNISWSALEFESSPSPQLSSSTQPYDAHHCFGPFIAISEHLQHFNSVEFSLFIHTTWPTSRGRHMQRALAHLALRRLLHHATMKMRTLNFQHSTSRSVHVSTVVVVPCVVCRLAQYCLRLPENQLPLHLRRQQISHPAESLSM